MKPGQPKSPAQASALNEPPDRLHARVREFLSAHHVATIATCGGGSPWAAAVFYLCDGATFYFLSSPDSRHAQNLAANARVALTVQQDRSDWLQIKGVQLEGTALEICGEEEARVRRLYGEKFPVVGLLNKAPSAIVKALARVRWYKVLPQTLYFIDNSRGLGHRDQLDPAAL